MPAVPLTEALSNLFGCEPKKLAEILNNPECQKKVTAYLKTKRLETTYINRDGVKKEVTFGNLSLKPVCELDAFEGYLGNPS
jgi:hypothetical protein